jgi:hypothetical protein
MNPRRSKRVWGMLAICGLLAVCGFAYGQETRTDELHAGRH